MNKQASKWMNDWRSEQTRLQVDTKCLWWAEYDQVAWLKVFSLRMIKKRKKHKSSQQGRLAIIFSGNEIHAHRHTDDYKNSFVTTLQATSAERCPQKEHSWLERRSCSGRKGGKDRWDEWMQWTCDQMLTQFKRFVSSLSNSWVQSSQTL